MIDNINNFLTRLVSNYLTEYMIYIIGLIGVGFIFLSLFLPKNIAFHKIDLKRMLNKNKEKLVMSKGIKYLHTLSRTGIFKLLILDEESDKYKKYDEQIEKSGGLSGCTPDIIYMLKWLLFFGIIIIFSIIIFIFLIIFPEYDFSFKFFVLGLFFALIGFFSPNLYLFYKIKKRRENFLSELDVIELFATMYLGAGNNVYDLLVVLSNVTKYTKNYINDCINEFYTGQEKALQNLSNKISLEEYQLFIDMLKQAIRVSGSNMASLVEDHMKQLKKMKILIHQSKSRKRPLKYVFILALPLISIIILWFYPLINDALKVFTQMGNI